MIWNPDHVPNRGFASLNYLRGIAFSPVLCLAIISTATNPAQAFNLSPEGTHWVVESGLAISAPAESLHPAAHPRRLSP